MKKLTTVSLLALLAPTGLEAQNFCLRLQTAEGPYDADRCLVTTLDESRTEALSRDTLTLTNHEAELTLNLDEVREATISFFRGETATLGLYMPLVPGDTLTLRATADGWEYGGSEFYRQAGEIKSRCNALEAQYRQDIANAADTAQRAIYEKFRADYTNTIVAYARQNPDAEGVVAWLPYAMGDAITVIKLLSARVRKESPVAPLVQRTLREEEEKADRMRELEKAKAGIREGAPAPDFTLKDIHGSDLTLSSLRGKYVILDFWGSWCVWCIRGMPKMKEYYAKYAGKVEILGIDCGDTEERWMKAVQDNELPWLHVYNPKDGTVTTTYAIEGFPTKILIAPDGSIAKVIVGESDDFYALLDELFGEEQ